MEEGGVEAGSHQESRGTFLVVYEFCTREVVDAGRVVNLVASVVGAHYVRNSDATKKVPRRPAFKRSALILILICPDDSLLGRVKKEGSRSTCTCEEFVSAFT